MANGQYVNGNNEQYGAVRVLGEHGNTLKKPGRNQLACPAQMLTSNK
jgi:hypothetical protein